MRMISQSSDEVARREDVLGINGLLEAFQDVDAGVSDTARHELLSQLADTVVMGDAASVFHDLVPCCILDLRVDGHWIGEALVDEAEVDVDTCSGVIDLNEGRITCVTLEERKGSFLMPCLLHQLAILLLTAEHILVTSFQGREVSKDSAMKLYRNPKSRRQPIMKVRKYPLSPFYAPALNPLYFFANWQITVIWFLTSIAEPSKRMVQSVILLGSKPMISVMKYFLAALTASCSLDFYQVLRDMPNWNCLLSIRRRLAGHTFDCETSYMNFTPMSKSWNRKDSYTFFSGIGRTLTVHSVMIPKLPSWPRMNSWMSGPELTLGEFCTFWKVPMGVAILTPMMISSMFPYRFFFMPEARVLTHPPSELNSTESGQCPTMTPNLDSSFSISLPMMPASMQAIILLLSTHLTLFILVTSTDTIVLFSSSWHIRDSVTLVPPPKGIKTTLCFFAASIKCSACSCEVIQTTQSTVLGNLPNRSRKSSFSEWPCEWKMRVILLVLISSTLPFICSMKKRFSTGGSIGISLCASTELLVSIPMTASTQSLNFGIFWPENWYLLPVIWTCPSSPRRNSVSLKPQPLFLNHCYLLRIDQPALTSSFSKMVLRFCNRIMTLQWQDYQQYQKRQEQQWLLCCLFIPLFTFFRSFIQLLDDLLHFLGQTLLATLGQLLFFLHIAIVKEDSHVLYAMMKP